MDHDRLLQLEADFEAADGHQPEVEVYAECRRGSSPRSLAKNWKFDGDD